MLPKRREWRQSPSLDTILCIGILCRNGRPRNGFGVFATTAARWNPPIEVAVA